MSNQAIPPTPEEVAARIAAAAELYLADHPELGQLDMRLDVILLAPGRPPLHLPGAFDAD